MCPIGSHDSKTIATNKEADIWLSLPLYHHLLPHFFPQIHLVLILFRVLRVFLQVPVEYVGTDIVGRENSTWKAVGIEFFMYLRRSGVLHGFKKEYLRTVEAYHM